MLMQDVYTFWKLQESASADSHHSPPATSNRRPKHSDNAATCSRTLSLAHDDVSRSVPLGWPQATRPVFRFLYAMSFTPMKWIH